MQVNLAQKICTGCGRTLPATSFHRTGSTRDGIHTRCKRCRGRNDRELYLAQRPERLAKAKAAYAANPGPMRAYAKERYASNPKVREDAIRRAKAYLPEGRRRRKANPIWVLADRVRDSLRRTLRAADVSKNSNTFELLGYTPAQLHERLAPFIGEPCEECGAVEISLDNSHLDHIEPIRTAVTEEDVVRLNALTNLRLICGPCNLGRPRG